MSKKNTAKTEAYLRSSCTDHSFKVPDEFNNWRIYFFNHSSCVREWSKWLGAKLNGKNPSVVTDMNPSKTLERKIKAIRESTKPDFQIIQQKAKNLMMDDKKTKEEPWKPAIPEPMGNNGSKCHVI